MGQTSLIVSEQQLKQLSTQPILELLKCFGIKRKGLLARSIALFCNKTQREGALEL